MRPFRTDILLTAFLVWILAAVSAPPECAAGSPPFRTHVISTSDGLPTDNVQQVFQDSEGYMWFATRSGLARFDGSRMEVFKSNIRNGDMLTNNIITSLTEDSLNRIWIGTPDGLNVYDKRKATLRKLDMPILLGNPISSILSTRAGRILIGTDQ